MEQVKLDSGIATNTFIKRYPQKEQRAHDFFIGVLYFSVCRTIDNIEMNSE